MREQPECSLQLAFGLCAVSHTDGGTQGGPRRSGSDCDEDSGNVARQSSAESDWGGSGTDEHRAMLATADDADGPDGTADGAPGEASRNSAGTQRTTHLTELDARATDESPQAAAQRVSSAAIRCRTGSVRCTRRSRAGCLRATACRRPTKGRMPSVMRRRRSPPARGS